MDVSLRKLPEQGTYKETKYFENLCLGYTLPDMEELLSELNNIQTIYVYFTSKDKKAKYNKKLLYILESNMYNYVRESYEDNEASIMHFGHMVEDSKTIFSKDEIKTFLLKKKMLGYLNNYLLDKYFNLFSLKEVYMYLQDGYSFEQVMANISNSLQILQKEIISLVQNGNWCNIGDIDFTNVRYFMTRTNKKVYLYIIPDAVTVNKNKMIYFMDAKINDATELLSMYLNYLFYKKIRVIQNTQFRQVNIKDIRGKIGQIL